MIKFLFEAIIRIAIIIPVAIIFLKEKNKTNLLRITIFIFCYVVYEVILIIPGVYQNFNFLNSNWNWVGKIFGIGWGIICYFLFKKYFIQNNFFTIRQNKINF